MTTLGTKTHTAPRAVTRHLRWAVAGGGVVQVEDRFAEREGSEQRDHGVRAQTERRVEEAGEEADLPN